MKNKVYYEDFKSYFNLLSKISMRMRLTFFFLFTLFTYANAESLYSQNTKLTLDMANVPVEEVLNTIEEKSEFYFLYNSKLINVDRLVTIRAKSKTIANILTDLFAKTDIVYKIEDRQIILSRKEFALQEQQQQGRVITGTVVDHEGEPIIGVNIRIKNSSGTGTITDMDGQFRLTVPQDAVLDITYIGYVAQEISVGNQNHLNIRLLEDTHTLDEVVVVGYGIQKKVNVTGAITAVKSEEISNVPVGNLSNALAGRAPGVTITGTSGFAGASSSIRMRGSFGEPLYVINNVIKTKADFDALDANEVENISFLKDAASASIYGSTAGNGVVLVTTKKGSQQKPMFQYKASFNTARTTKPLQKYTATDELIWNNRVAETKGREPLYGQEIFDYFADKNYDVADYVWRNPSSQQHNVSVDGGNDRITYYMMVGVHDENGSYKNVDYSKYNFRSDITAKITDRFKVNFNLNGNQRDYSRFYWPYDDAESMNLPDFYRTTFNWTRLYPFYVDDKGDPTSDTSANPVTFGAWNPVEMVIGDRYHKIKKRTIDGLLRFDLDLGQFVDGLRVSFQGQYTAIDENHKQFITHNKGYRFKSSSATNPFKPGPIDPNDMVVHNLSSSYEGIKEGVILEHSYQINWFVNYDKQFGKHGISALAVYEQSESDGKKLKGEAMDLMTSSIDQIFATSEDTQRRFFDGNEYAKARQSWVGRLNYSYADKYIAEFSFRYDGNYKFSPDERWGFFPSGSAAWRISEENFMKGINWLSHLKLRGSYGSTGDDMNWNGDDNIAAFRWRETYKNNTGFMFGDNYMNGLSVNSIANPFITWAKLEVYDIGLDFGFFNNRLTGEFDYFYKKKSDILKERKADVPGTYGAKLAEENYAEQDWRGAEIALRWSDRYKDINYSVYGNMGYVKDKWLKMDEAAGLESWQSQIGRPNERIKGYIAEGIIRTQEQLDALPDGFTQFGRKPILGTILYKDIRGANYAEGADGKIDSNDETYLSYRGTPRINYGFGFNLEWKGITLDAHFQGVGGYDRMLKTKNGGGVFQINDRPYFQLWTQDVWTPDNPNAKYPRVSGEWQEEYGAAGSTFWMRNGAYLRLKNLNIGYTLPKQWLSGIGIQRLQVFVNSTNLFHITSLKEHDPEQETLDSFPLMRTFTAGLSINF